jgi:hypothetical protein
MEEQTNKPSKKNITSFKLGHKGFKGSANGMWRGEKVGYSALHDRIRARTLEPWACPKCARVVKLDLANISGEYKTSLDDWVYLCKRCHRAFDRPNIKITRNKNGTFKTVCSLIKLNGGKRK